MPPPTLHIPTPAQLSAPVPEKKKKKEKPKDKTPIPGTSWIRVKTSEGNVFFMDKETKRSEWVVPDEIKVCRNSLYDHS